MKYYIYFKDPDHEVYKKNGRKFLNLFKQVSPDNWEPTKLYSKLMKLGVDEYLTLEYDDEKNTLVVVPPEKKISDK